MARDVLHRIDEYESARKKKRARIAKVAASVTPVCAAAVVGVGLWKSGVFAPAHDQLISNSVDSTVSTADYILSENGSSENNQFGSKTEITSKTNDPDGQTEKFDVSGSSTSENTHIEVASPNSVNNEHGEVNKPQNTNDTPQNSSDTTHHVQTSPPVQKQTEPNLVVTDMPIKDNQSSNGWCIFVSSIELNGITYHDNDIANAAAYTQSEYIGKVRDYSGEYQDNAHYRISSDDSVYSVKETNNVLLVVKSNGTIIVMTSPEWSLQKNEPERPDSSVDFDSPDNEDLTVFNGFCQ